MAADAFTLLFRRRSGQPWRPIATGPTAEAAFARMHDFGPGDFHVCRTDRLAQNARFPPDQPPGPEADPNAAAGQRGVLRGRGKFHKRRY